MYGMVAAFTPVAETQANMVHKSKGRLPCEVSQIPWPLSVTSILEGLSSRHSPVEAVASGGAETGLELSALGTAGAGGPGPVEGFGSSAKLLLQVQLLPSRPVGGAPVATGKQQ